MTRGGYALAAVFLSLLALSTARVFRASGAATPKVVAGRTPILDPNQTEFPDSSLADFTATLDAPAGKHGFLSVGADGHLQFEDGARARFFGVNIAKTSVFQPKQRIDRVVGVLARAGINLVRFHHLDDVGGVIDVSRGDSRHLAADRLEVLDYWIAELKKRGIYSYLDLLDYRTFRSGDGVAAGEALGRGARPYAVFDRRLIVLQKEYARRLLVEHVNRYTGQPYARDPAVAMVELMDENGLLIRGHQWRTLAQPYRRALQSLWNSWLGQAYGTSARLRAAWTNSRGQCALGSEEQLERGTVELPDMTLPRKLQDDYRQQLTAAARRNDGARFAYAVHRAYLAEMREYLREQGVRVPLGAVVSREVIADLRSEAEELDYVGVNYFFDHPKFTSRSPWQLPSYWHDRNPLGAGPNSFAPAVSLARMHGKPLVVRECGYGYPNRYRAVGMIEASAYARRLDLDALILFHYDLHQPEGGLDYFDLHADPTRWGLAAIAARIFLGDHLTAAPKRVVIAYSDVDCFSLVRHQSELYQLAWLARLENHCYRDSSEAEADLTISSGRSGWGALPGEGCLIFTNERHLDLGMRQVGDEVAARSGYRLSRGPEGGTGKFSFEGLLYDQGQVRSWPTSGGYRLDQGKAQGLLPIGVSREKGLTCGFRDPQRNNLVFGTLSYRQAFRAGLDALRLLGEAGVSHADDDRGVFGSGAAPVQRDVAHGLIKINSPTLQAVAGRIGQPSLTKVGALRLRTSTPVGALVAMSLDGKPLAESQAYLIKFCSIARNTGEQLTGAQGRDHMRKLIKRGRRPIVTDGKPSTEPTEVWVNQHKLAEAYLVNGTWELLVQDGRWSLFCDTPGARFVLPEAKGNQLTVTGRSGRLGQGYPRGGFKYPSGAHFVVVGP